MIYCGHAWAGKPTNAQPQRRRGCTGPSLTPPNQAATLPHMTQGKKKSSGSRETSKPGIPLGLVIVLAAAGGVIAGSAGTYYLTRPQTATQQSAAPAVGAATPAPVITMSPPPAQQNTPGPQPPGEAPPGKVWSVEHGHWHDLPVTQVSPTPVPPAANPAAPIAPAPVVVPAEKK